MDKVTEKKYWQEAYRRFQLIKWEAPVTKEQVEIFHATLPDRYENEEVENWLQRTLKPRKSRFIWFTPIMSRAAADDSLPDTLETIDERLKFEFFQKEGKILVKAEIGGVDLDELANAKIGIAAQESPEDIVIEIQLNHYGKGEEYIKDTPEIRRVLWNPVAGQLCD
jgi:hypothetical protein